MIDKMLEKDAKNILHVPNIAVSGYVILLGCGIFVYCYSIVGIYDVHMNDFFKLLAKVLLVSYFIVGIITLHVCVRFFNRMVMTAALGLVVLFWTVLTSSLYVLQLSSGHLWVQILYSVIVVFQLLCLGVTGTQWVPSTFLRKKVLQVYVVFTVTFFLVTMIPPLLNGDGRWSRPGHTGWYVKQFGPEVGEILMWMLVACMIIIVIVASFIWMITRVAGRWHFHKSDLNISESISGYLFYQHGRWGYSGVWGYLAKGVRDFPDAVTFLEEKEGVYRFKKKGTTTRIEEFILSKENVIENGIFSCEFIGEQRQIEKVMVLYEEKHGKWRPYEFEEVEEKE